jgi:hypothetical protein
VKKGSGNGIRGINYFLKLCISATYYLHSPPSSSGQRPSEGSMEFFYCGIIIDEYLRSTGKGKEGAWEKEGMSRGRS